jgi:hypothetical protein
VVNADDAVILLEGSANLENAWQPANASLASSALTGTIATETWLIVPPAGAPEYYIRVKAALR